MSTDNVLKLKLKEDKPIIGIWSIVSSPVMVEILALSGFDFVILDMEHGIYDQTALDACIRAVEVAGSAPLVRVPGINPSATQWALDLGAYGVIVPQVVDAASAAVSVEMAKFAPEGTRGYNPFTRVAAYAAPNNNHAGKLNNDFGLTCVIAENQTALNELDQILRIEHLDVVYVGVYDLSVSLGCDGNTRHPKVEAVLKETVARVRSAGKVAGLMVRNKEEIVNAIRMGARFLVYSVDTYLLHQAAIDAVSSFVQGAGEA